MSSRQKRKRPAQRPHKSQNRPYDNRPRSGPGRAARRTPTDENAVRVVLPDEPPRLTPGAARALLRILLKAHDRLNGSDDPEETPVIRFAFYGRVSTEDQQDPESSRAWQLTRSRALIEPRDGVIVAEFFDVDKSRSIPWQRRPQATALLAELKNPNRDFDAVVIGEPHRAFYGNQYGLTFPLFEHYGVPLWVPEVGGPIDPRNEAHDLVMSRVRRDEQGRAEPDQDPRPGRHGAPRPRTRAGSSAGARPTAT